MVSAQLESGEVAIQMDSYHRKQVRKEREDLQKKIQSELKTILKENPAIEANVTKLTHFLKDHQWKRLDDLAQTIRGFEPPNDFSPPRPKIISYDQVKAVEDLFVNPTGKLNYLKHLIPYFNIENVLFGKRRYAPIHYAAEALDEEFLGWLLSQLDASGHALIDVNLRNKDKKTALYMLCEKYDKCTNELASSTEEQRASRIGNREKIVKLINQLLQVGADFNIYSDPNQLPFDLLFKHLSNDIALQQLMDLCVSQPNRLIAYNVCLENESNGRLIMFYPEDQENREVYVTAELLELFLQFGDLENFNRHWERFCVGQKNVKKVIELVLQVAVARKLGAIVRQIITKANDLIFEKHEWGPKFQHRVELKGLLMTAILAGNLEMIEFLLPMMKDDQELVNYDPLLVQTLEKAHSTRQRESESDNFLKCAKYLINSNSVSLHKASKTENTPLHLAVKYGYEEIVVALLEHGCGSLGVCNQANLTPLECGTRSFWRACFNKFIKGDTSKQDWKTIDFDTNCFRSPAVDRKATVKHMGWKKFIPIRSASQVSVRSDERVVVTEMTPLRRMAESKELKRLLTHPVIYSFVMVKWVRLSILHLLNLLLTVITMGTFGWFSLSVCNVVELPTYWHIFLVFLILLLSLITLAREGIQLYLLPRSYATFENFVDIGNIVAIFVNVFIRGCDPIMSSLVLLVFSLQMVFMLSALPFKQLSTIMYMFKTVAINFIQSLLLFLPLIGTFVFAFYLSYNGNVVVAVTESNGTAVGNETTEENDFHKFRTILTAVVKTMVMTTGELDAADMDLSGGKVLLFCVFVFITPLVILNLMNGLAVSDIAAIQEKSELISISKKVIELERNERLMVSLKSEWMRSRFPKPFLKHYSSKIGVRIDELGKILLRRKPEQQLSPTEQPASRESNTVGNGASDPLLSQNSEPQSPTGSRKPNTIENGTAAPPHKPDQQCQSKQKDTFSQPLFAPIFREGTDIVLDFGFLQMTSFLTLDRTILAEALSVIEDRAEAKRCKHCKKEL